VGTVQHEAPAGGAVPAWRGGEVQAMTTFEEQLEAIRARIEARKERSRPLGVLTPEETARRILEGPYSEDEKARARDVLEILAIDEVVRDA
jgi:hypothetical protein